VSVDVSCAQLSSAQLGHFGRLSIALICFSGCFSQPRGLRVPHVHASTLHAYIYVRTRFAPCNLLMPSSAIESNNDRARQLVYSSAGCSRNLLCIARAWSCMPAAPAASFTGPYPSDHSL